ncbi:MAG: Gfo/Idh/MocA family oxidoreductase [Rhodothermales bacterium]|nr:Gfo/Idh/MocA family oxidoreductase [Rhodothermales bacterium]
MFDDTRRPRRITRRDFNQSMAAAMGLAPLISCGDSPDPSAADVVLPQDTEKLGIALVGMGNYSTNQLAPALNETRFCRLAGIVTGTPSKAEMWQNRDPGLEGHVYDYETFDRIADDDAIDIVYVVLPNSMHAEFTIRAAQAGKHVICEKPMAVSSAEAQSMIDACEAANRRLYIGYRLHYEPHNVEAMRLGQEQAYGKVKYVHTEFGFRIGDPGQWRLKKSLAGGGALMDVGIYAVQAARYVTGEEPVEVTAQEYKTDPVKFAEVDETITWQLTFPSGCVATSSTTYAARSERLFAAAERGWWELRPAYIYGGIEGRTSEGPMDYPQVNQQALHMDAVAESIMNDSDIRIDGVEGLRDMKIIEAIYESARTGSPVSL